MQAKTNQSNKKLTSAIIALIMSMVLLSCAAVPIYNLFCKLTGFAGTTQRASTYSHVKGSKIIKVHFDANVDPGLPWKFIPKHNNVDVMTGENVLIFYYSKNLSDKDIIGTAVYNVTPQKAGKYFNKVHCFCFEEQENRIVR